MEFTTGQVIEGIVSNNCPNCHEGKIYRGVSMNVTCPNCHYKFEKEAGYFLGSLSITYIISFFVILPLFLILLFTGQPLYVVAGIPTGIAIIMNPFIRRIARLIWIWVDFKTGK